MEKSIVYKNSKVYFTDEGKGRSIVLLHGFLENSTMWHSLVAMLVKDFRVICIDLLGHGKSDNVGYVHTMEEMASVVRAVVTSLQIKKSFLVGHSMGGYVALAYADVFPDAVKGLVLLNSTARADSEEKQLGRDRAIAAVKENHLSFIRTAIPLLFRPKCRKLHAVAIANLKKEALQTSKQGIVAALEGMKIRADREMLLRFGPYPKLMLIGEKDPVLKLEDLLQQTNHANTEVVCVPNGHMSLIEDEEKTKEALLNFFKKHQ